MEVIPAPDPGPLPSSGHLANAAGVPTEPLPAEPAPPQPLPPARRRLRALAEVLACSGYPTQVVSLLVVWGLSGGALGPGRALGLAGLASVIALDSAAIVALVWMFLRAGGECPTDTLFGQRRWLRETLLGIWLLPAVLGIVAALALAVGRFAPWLRQAENPFALLVDSPLDAAILAAIAVVGGGVREEVQRAFILHRFEQHLGGALFGLVVFSAAFGLLHRDMQGSEAAIITGALGAFWGLLYFWRRSVVAPAVSHASFNVLEVLIALQR